MMNLSRNGRFKDVGFGNRHFIDEFAHHSIMVYNAIGGFVMLFDLINSDKSTTKKDQENYKPEPKFHQITLVAVLYHK